MANSFVDTGGFAPREIRPPVPPVGGVGHIDDTAVRTKASELATMLLLQKNQKANPKFDPGTLGDTGYIDGAEAGPVRGFIRRASPTSSDLMSNALLHFMYNPEAVVRDYVSYMDQEALDPFNTVYGSGNLIAPPSFINFSFSLFFDRMVQTANGVTPRGVLEDYDFFDMVVRNVAPGGGTSVVPDNGIMMVNPKDITVVFSKYLTVQGRPTNAQVVFERFNSEMVPVRMQIRLNMIVTYFGPQRDPFTFDTNQQIGQWEAMVPYDKIYKVDFTEADVKTAREQYDKSRSETAAYLNAVPRNASWANAAVTGSNVASTVSAASGSLARDTLQYGRDNIIENGGTKYDQAGSRRANLPASADCSGALWCCYKAYGATKILHPGGDDYAANTDSIEKAIGKTLTVVCEPRNMSEADLRSKILPGDILLNRSTHVAMFDNWDAGAGKFGYTHQTSGSHNGTVTSGISYLKQFTWVLRPNPGGSTSTGTWV